MIDKFVHSMPDAMAGIADGSTVLLGGFGDVGIPTPLLTGLIEQGARDLTIVAVAGGRDGSAIEQLLSLGRVRRLICSFVRPASLAARLFQRGDLKVEIVPQGTLAERMRAAGAGITGFYTPTGADTLLAEGRETPTSSFDCIGPTVRSSASRRTTAGDRSDRAPVGLGVHRLTTSISSPGRRTHWKKRGSSVAFPTVPIGSRFRTVSPEIPPIRSSRSRP